MTEIKIAWCLLGVSILAEVLGTLGLKLSFGFTRILPSVFTIACYAGAIWLMALSVKVIDVGMAYAVWAGASTALTFLAAIVLFGESITALKAAGLFFTIVGLVILNISEGIS